MSIDARVTNYSFFFGVVCVTLDGLQLFLLPIVLGTSLLSMGVANTLYAASFGWYFYITHLGYRGEDVSPFLTLTNVKCLAYHHSQCFLACDYSTSISFQY